jgi:formiminotetrahydrofolate cyclodeaminase
MAASLLAMVCGIPMKNDKHRKDVLELRRLRARLLKLEDELTSLAREDALAYDSVSEAYRSKAGRPERARKITESLKLATRVPLRTAAACATVLEMSVRVAQLGVRSASSDVTVAILLADAGLKGAAANVRINTDSLRIDAFVRSTTKKLAVLEKRAEPTVRAARCSLK